MVNAIYVWGLARAHGARVLLRVEDHDAQRCQPEFERALLDDLEWLGFEPDDYPTSMFRAGACASRQSDRQEVYVTAARELIARRLVYGCDCSRQRIRDAAAGAGRVDWGAADELRYPGTCRDRGLDVGEGIAWRLRLEPETIAFDDLLCGPQQQTPSDQCGDLLIRDRLGNWTYQFVAAVDDFRQRIDLVVRGRDLLASTGRQIQTARLLGRTTPAHFGHHALVMKTPTQKLSKSDRDTGIRDLRARGWTAARTIGHAASLVGLLPDGQYLQARSVGELFRQKP